MDDSVAAALPQLLEAALHPQPLDRLRDIIEASPSLATGSITRAGWRDWTDAAADLPDEHVAALIRVITLAEETVSEWGGGSVSPVIWLFRVYSRRKGVDTDELADWVLAHTSNDWAPYGKLNGGARSVAELRGLRWWGGTV